MAIGYILMSFVLFVSVADIWLGNYSSNEVQAYWITAIVTFFVLLSSMLASVRFGRHSTQVNTKIYGLAGVLGSLVAPVVMPALLERFEISQHTLLLFGGGWVAGIAAAIMVAMPVIEIIVRKKRAPIYLEPPTDDSPSS